MATDSMISITMRLAWSVLPTTNASLYSDRACAQSPRSRARSPRSPSAIIMPTSNCSALNRPSASSMCRSANSPSPVARAATARLIDTQPDMIPASRASGMAEAASRDSSRSCVLRSSSPRAMANAASPISASAAPWASPCSRQATNPCANASRPPSFLLEELGHPERHQDSRRVSRDWGWTELPGRAQTKSCLPDSWIEPARNVQVWRQASRRARGPDDSCSQTSADRRLSCSTTSWSME